MFVDLRADEISMLPAVAALSSVSAGSVAAAIESADSSV